jgi:modulator of FtsH protease HflK
MDRIAVRFLVRLVMLTRVGRYAVSILIILIGIYTLATALTQVQPGERAVVRRFGRLLPEQPRPGLHVGWPWGIDQVERVSVARIRRVAVGFTGKDEAEDIATPAGQLLTGDHNLVNVQAEIHYKVIEAEVEKYFLQADRADVLVARAAEAALADWIAGRTVDEVLLRGKAILPVELVTQVQERLRPCDLGVRIEVASITRLNPPDEVKDAFDRVAQAQNNIETQVNFAHENAKRKLRDAEAEVFRIERLTAAYSKSQELQAKSEADNFLKRLQQYRQLSRANAAYLNTLWLDEMSRLFARMQSAGRIDLLDHYLTGDGLSILQFPTLPRKK